MRFVVLFHIRNRIRLWREVSAMKYSNEGRTNYYNLFDEKPRCYHVMKEFISAKHVHRETEITYPVNGSVDVVVREKTFHVQMQDMLIIPRNAMHYYIRIDPDIDIVNVKFADEWLVPAFSDPHALEYMKQLPRPAQPEEYMQKSLLSAPIQPLRTWKTMWLPHCTP